MYINSRGDFLILMEKKEKDTDGSHPIRAIVRKVALQQLGHWMMGTARIGGESITMSGAYGSDGLICTVPDHVWEMGVPLPTHLYELWSVGGGHNSAGSEAGAMKRWANENIGLLVSKSDRRSTQ